MNITMNYKMSELVQSSMNFLGHIISVQGIQTDPDKIKSIPEFPIPKIY